MGFIFLYLWLMLVSLYPKSVVIGEDSIAINMMGSSKAKIIKFADLQVNDKNAYYELAVDRNGTRRKYLISKNSIPHELEQIFKEHQ